MLAVVLMSCSTQKNTWSTRTFHQIKTKYNIYYNGQLAFKDGEEATREANEDDYSTILNLYPVSNHEAAQFRKDTEKEDAKKTSEKLNKIMGKLWKRFLR